MHPGGGASVVLRGRHGQLNRVAQVLVDRFGLVPGARVLRRAFNTLMMVAACLAVIKAGAIAVATMPLLRARELAHIIDKAEIGLALRDHRLLTDLMWAQRLAPRLAAVVAMGGDGADDLVQLCAGASALFEPYPSRADDTCLIAFTSGTTGQPKGTMHFHRDLLAICDCYGARVLQAGAVRRVYRDGAVGVHVWTINSCRFDQVRKL